MITNKEGYDYTKSLIYKNEAHLNYQQQVLVLDYSTDEVERMLTAPRKFVAMLKRELKDYEDANKDIL